LCTCRLYEFKKIIPATTRRSNGSIVSRKEYFKIATDFYNNGYTSYNYKQDNIRIFNKTILVRAKTIYAKSVDLKVKGCTLYNDALMALCSSADYTY
jgi:hypothetical protein